MKEKDIYNKIKINYHTKIEVIILEKKTMTMAMIVGGMAMIGYYLMKNPDMMCQMRHMTKEMAKKTYEKLDDQM